MGYIPAVHTVEYCIYQWFTLISHYRVLIWPLNGNCMWLVELKCYTPGSKKKDVPSIVVNQPSQLTGMAYEDSDCTLMNAVMH